MENREYVEFFIEYLGTYLPKQSYYDYYHTTTTGAYKTPNNMQHIVNSCFAHKHNKNVFIFAPFPVNTFLWFVYGCVVVLHSTWPIIYLCLNIVYTYSHWYTFREPTP